MSADYHITNPKEGKKLCGQHSRGELQSPEGSGSRLEQSQLSLLRTNGWETMIEMLVLYIVVPLLLISA